MDRAAHIVDIHVVLDGRFGRADGSAQRQVRVRAAALRLQDEIAGTGVGQALAYDVQVAVHERALAELDGAAVGVDQQVAVEAFAAVEADAGTDCDVTAIGADREATTPEVVEVVAGDADALVAVYEGARRVDVALGGGGRQDQGTAGIGIADADAAVGGADGDVLAAEVLGLHARAGGLD